MNNVHGVRSYDGAIAVEAQYKYKPFGELARPLASPEVDSRFKFAGQDYYAFSKLYHMGARYQAPDLGRFQSRDPVPAHDYVYAANNPVSFYDPSGLDAAWEEARLADIDAFLAEGELSNAVAGLGAGIGATGESSLPIGQAGEAVQTETSISGVGPSEPTVNALAPLAGPVGPQPAGVQPEVGVTGVEPTEPTTSETTVKLKAITGQAKENVEEAIQGGGRAGFTLKQRIRLFFHPEDYNKLFGQRVDVESKRLARLAVEHEELPGVVIAPNFIPAGELHPDVVSLEFDVWWDVTTPTAWQAHETRYGGLGEGIPLFY